MSFIQPDNKYIIQISYLISFILTITNFMDLASQIKPSEFTNSKSIGFTTAPNSNRIKTSSDDNAISLINPDPLNRYYNTHTFKTSSSTDTNSPLSSLIHSFVSFSTIATPDTIIPFWMRSNKYGSIPLAGLSVSGIVGVKKEYKTNKKFDWGASFEGRLNAGSKIEGIIVEANAKLHYGAFQLKAGRSKEIMGLVDSTLSTGAFSVSGNALGIPKVEISFPEYTDIPFTNGLFAIKGNFAHGWFGEQNANGEMINSYLHQASVYARIGKQKWKVNFFGGFNHVVMWGNEDQIYSDYEALSKWKIYWYVITGKAYGDKADNSSVPRSKIGNHLGSVDQGMTIKLNKYNLFAYHQFFYEAGALASLANIKDGIWGLSIKNNFKSSSTFSFQKMLFEFVYSKSQGGEVDSKPRNSGAENYYNNFIYNNGWTYRGENIGNPLFTSKNYINPDLPFKENQYFRNNRLVSFHFGGFFNINKWSLKTLLTWSNNYGTYSVAPASRGRGSEIYYNDPPYFEKTNQFSGAIEIQKKLKKSFLLQINLHSDHGVLLNNAIGGEIKFLRYL